MVSHTIPLVLNADQFRLQINAIIADLLSWGTAAPPAAVRGENSIYVQTGAPTKIFQVQTGAWVQIV